MFTKALVGCAVLLGRLAVGNQVAQTVTSPVVTSHCYVLASLPADSTEDDSHDHRQRFELARCGSGAITVFAFERNQSNPSLVVHTGDDYPPYLVHVRNVLVFQSLGGSSDHVFVFTFQRGKPSLALKTATKGQITVRLSRNRDRLRVEVPLTLYHGTMRPLGTPPTKAAWFPLEF